MQQDDGDMKKLLELIDRAARSQQDDDGDEEDSNADLQDLNELSEEQGDEDGDNDDDETAEMEGFVSKLRQIFKMIKRVGKVLNNKFPNNKYITKYSKYLQCLPSFQEEIELVTTQSDEEDLETLLNTLEAQAQSDEEISQVQFFRKFFNRAKRYGGRLWKKFRSISPRKIFKVIQAVKKYLQCIRKSIKALSLEETKQVEEQAMQVLQKAITGRVVRI